MSARVIDGIENLKSLIGQEAGVSDWVPVTQQMIDRFAELTGDDQWIHLDAERARRESPFGSTIAHGFLTVALLSRLVSEAVRVEGPFRMRVNYGFNRLRFPSPVPAGVRVRARVTPVSVKDFEGGHEVTWSVTVEVEGRDKPALVAEWLGRMYF